MKGIIFAAALLLLAATAAFASDEDKEKWPPPPSAEQIHKGNMLGTVSANDFESKREKQVVAGMYCVTYWGTCMLTYPMWDGSTCTCSWLNGTSSVGYVQ